MLKLAKRKLGPDGDRVYLSDDEVIAVMDEEGNQIFTVTTGASNEITVRSSSISARALVVHPVARNTVNLGFIS